MFRKFVGFFGSKMVGCADCGELRLWGQPCDYCDADPDTYRPRGGEILRNETFGDNELISEQEVRRATGRKDRRGGKR